MKPASIGADLFAGLIKRQVLWHLRPQGFAPAQQIFGHGERAVDVFRGERLHEAAEREVGHRKARRLAADEQARNAQLVEPDRDREARGPVGQMKIEEHQIGIVFLRGGDGGFGVVGHRHDAVARIVLDQIFERDCQL